MWRISFGRDFRNVYYASTPELPVVLAELIEGLIPSAVDDYFHNADSASCHYYRAVESWIDRIRVEACAHIV
jgi:hypothetical protein